MAKDADVVFDKKKRHRHVSYYNKKIAGIEDEDARRHEVPLLEHKDILYHDKKKVKIKSEPDDDILPIPEIYL